MSTRIRTSQPADLEALTALYNHYIAHSPATFDIEPKSVEERAAWMGHYAETGRHRMLVAEREGRIVGFATTSALRPKAAYETSVETTIYLDPECTGAGIGRALYGALFEAVADEDIHRAYAGITLPNAASVTLHERFGFRPIAVYDEVGRKFDRYWSVQWFEKRLR